MTTLRLFLRVRAEFLRTCKLTYQGSKRRTENLLIQLKLGNCFQWFCGWRNQSWWSEKKKCKINLLNSGRRSIEEQLYWGTKTEYFAWKVCIFTTGKRTLHRIITILPKDHAKGNEILVKFEFNAFKFRAVNFFSSRIFSLGKDRSFVQNLWPIRSKK